MPQNPRLLEKSAAGIVRLEQDRDGDCIQKMYCEAFGPGRFARTAYRIREGGDFARQISCVVEHRDKAGEKQACIAGTIRFSRIGIGQDRDKKRGKALLLGPLVVSEHYRGYNYGIALMRHGLELARLAGFDLVILVGDLAYYQKAGFRLITAGDICLPAPYDPGRLLAYEIRPGCLEHYRGLISGIKE